MIHIHIGIYAHACVCMYVDSARHLLYALLIFGKAWQGRKLLGKKHATSVKNANCTVFILADDQGSNSTPGSFDFIHWTAHDACALYFKDVDLIVRTIRGYDSYGYMKGKKKTKNKQL